MKRKRILLILASRTAHHAISVLIIAAMLGGVWFTLKEDTEDIKFFIDSILAGDPYYNGLQESVSENMIRGNIDIETQLVETEEKAKEEKTLVSNDTKSGYDSYVPKESSQSSSSNTSSSSTSSSSVASSSNSSTNNSNASNSNNNKQEQSVDRSSFNGKDAVIDEGQPFNPSNALQFYASDVNGENITNSIVIVENNVNTHKPGTYTVRASVNLKNGQKIDKKFAVKVKPTVLNLAVNDVRTSKEDVKKSENYTIDFAVDSSKDYIDVEKVVINKKQYDVQKVAKEGSKRYSVNLVAADKAGDETLKLQKVIMSDKTVVDIDKTININVLKDDATLSDVVIEDESNENNSVKVEFNLKDADNTITEPKICIYDENNNLVVEKKFSKSKYSSETKINTKFNLDKSGTYTIKVLASKNDNTSEKYINESNIVELLSRNITVNIKEVSNDENIDLMTTSLDNEDIAVHSQERKVSSISRTSRASNGNITGSDDTEQQHNISITGKVISDSGEVPSGTLHVVVPTAASFTVDKNGNFTGTSITVRNQGYQDIDVYAYKFIDVDGTAGINVKSKSEVTTNPTTVSRSNISLNILGNESTAYFKTEDINGEKTGVYTDEQLQNTASSDGVKISTIPANSDGTLTLQGEAGKKSNIDTAISNTFTLMLKIKKSTN